MEPPNTIPLQPGCVDEQGREALRVAENFLKKTNTQGKIIFAVVTGSQAYNVAQEGSDFDYKAVYFAPTEMCLGLDIPAETVSTHSFTDKSGPDMSVYEAKQFCNLVLEGDPFALELVFSDRYYYCSEEWLEFVKLRRELLTAAAATRHVKYSTHQLEKYARKPQPGKRIYHMIRLLFAVEDMQQGRGICIWLEGERRELILKIRMDGFTKEEFVAMAEKRFAQAKEQCNSMSARDPPREKVEQWLITSRCSLLAKKNP